MGLKMLSKTRIFKDALIVLGNTPDIVDADNDEGSVAITLRGAWDTAVETVIRDFAWQCLRVEAPLTLVGTAPTRWAFQYKYPADCAKALEIVKNIRTEPDIPFEVGLYKDDDNGWIRVIRTDRESALLSYTLMSKEVYLYDTQLGKAIAGYLAYSTASVLTTAKDAAGKAWEHFVRAKNEAWASDANEQKADPEQDSEFIRART